MSSQIPQTNLLHTFRLSPSAGSAPTPSINQNVNSNTVDAGDNADSSNERPYTMVKRVGWNEDTNKILLEAISEHMPMLAGHGEVRGAWKECLDDFNERAGSNVFQSRTISAQFKKLLGNFERKKGAGLISSESITYNESVLERIMAQLDNVTKFRLRDSENAHRRSNSDVEQINHNQVNQGSVEQTQLNLIPIQPSQSTQPSQPPTRPQRHISRNSQLYKRQRSNVPSPSLINLNVFTSSSSDTNEFGSNINSTSQGTTPQVIQISPNPDVILRYESDEIKQINARMAILETKMDKILGFLETMNDNM